MHMDPMTVEEKRQLLAKLLWESAREAEEILPLSYGQQALWFLYQLEPENPAYNIHFAGRITSGADPEELRRAFQAIVDSHAALRSTYALVDGVPLQTIHENVELPFEVIDATDLEWEALRECLREEYRRPFDLERGPVLRLKLYRRAAEEYIMLLTIHHIAVDYWSLVVILDELSTLLPAAEQEEAKTAVPAVPYKEYVRWQKAKISGPEGERLWTFWQEALPGGIKTVELPVTSKTPNQKHDGATYLFQLDAELVAGLKALSKSTGVTLYTILLTAFQILLGRYSGQNEVIVGSPTSGRSQTQFESVVGYFVNLVLLRADFRDNPTFADLLARMRKTVIEAIDHQDFPFPLLVERLSPNREASRSTPIRAVFALQKAPRLEEQGMSAFMMGNPDARLQLGKLVIEPIDLPQQEGQFDLNLHMDAQTLTGALQYRPSIFDRSTIAQMAKHLQVLLGAIVCNPDARISELPILTEEERQQFAQWNDTATPYPEDVSIHQLFESQAAKRPEAVALLYRDEQLTYRELNEWANQIAHSLIEAGIKPGDRVGIMMERSMKMVISALAVLKAGGAYVPLDPAYPTERHAYILKNADVKLLLTNVEAELDMAPSGCRELQWETLHQAALQASKANPDIVFTKEQLAYIIYTSGSTGTPKGVVVRHQPVINLFDWVNKTFAVGEADRMLWITSLGFDLSVYDLFGMLAAGGSIRIADEEEVREPERLLAYLDSGEITFWDSAPAALQQLVPFLDRPSREFGKSNLRLVFLSGDWIPIGMPDLLKEHFPQVEVVALGGGTEATVWSNFYRIREVAKEWVSIPYGKPIQNARYYVLDSHLNQCPVGIPGELYIGGECLAEGYANDPALTEARFISDPYGKPGGRMYRTGDLARYWPDGNLEFLGRVDNQVKIRGYRIELGEIEKAITSHPEVRSAVALAYEETPGDKRLVAYVVAKPNANLTPGDIRQFIKASLPPYMVPAAYIFVDGIPVTTNGKVDRSALPKPVFSRSDLGQEYVEPRTSAEAVLAEIWSDILGHKQVGVHDNFFELGGHSLLATQVVTRVQEQLEVELSLKEMFEHQTIETLAKVIEQKVAEAIEGLAEEEVWELLKVMD